MSEAEEAVVQNQQNTNGECPALITSNSPGSTKSYITGTGQASPYRHVHKRDIYNKKKLSQNKRRQVTTLEESYNEKMTDKSNLRLTEMKQQQSYYKANGAPPRTSQSQNRGYSLLNPPVSMISFDDTEEVNKSYDKKIKKDEVTAEFMPNGQIYMSIRSHDKQSKNELMGANFPDVLFHGFAVETDLTFTVEKRRNRRKSRKTCLNLAEGSQGDAIIQQQFSSQGFSDQTIVNKGSSYQDSQIKIETNSQKALGSIPEDKTVLGRDISLPLKGDLHEEPSKISVEQIASNLVEKQTSAPHLKKPKRVQKNDITNVINSQSKDTCFKEVKKPQNNLQNQEILALSTPFHEGIQKNQTQLGQKTKKTAPSQQAKRQDIQQRNDRRIGQASSQQQQLTSQNNQTGRKPQAQTNLKASKLQKKDKKSSCPPKKKTFSSSPKVSSSRIASKPGYQQVNPKKIPEKNSQDSLCTDENNSDMKNQIVSPISLKIHKAIDISSLQGQEQSVNKNSQTLVQDQKESTNQPSLTTDALKTISCTASVLQKKTSQAKNQRDSKQQNTKKPTQSKPTYQRRNTDRKEKETSRNKSDQEETPAFENQEIAQSITFSKCAIKRSNTRSERASQLNMTSSAQVTTERRKIRDTLTARQHTTHENKKKLVNNMPLQNNQRIKQNLYVQDCQFIDSDYFEGHSTRRGQSRQRNFQNRVGSTFSRISPNSRASGKIGPQYSKQRGSNAEFVNSSMKASNNYANISESTIQEDLDAFQPSAMNILIEKEMSDKIISLKSGEFTTATTKPRRIKPFLSSSPDRQSLNYRNASLLNHTKHQTLSPMYRKKMIERREKQLKLLNQQAKIDKSHEIDSLNMIAIRAVSNHGNRMESDLKNQSTNLNPILQTLQVKSKQQSGLATLRKVHDQLFSPSIKNQRNHLRIGLAQTQRGNDDFSNVKLPFQNKIIQKSNQFCTLSDGIKLRQRQKPERFERRNIGRIQPQALAMKKITDNDTNVIRRANFDINQSSMLGINSPNYNSVNSQPNQNNIRWQQNSTISAPTMGMDQGVGIKQLANEQSDERGGGDTTIQEQVQPTRTYQMEEQQATNVKSKTQLQSSEERPKLDIKQQKLPNKQKNLLATQPVVRQAKNRLRMPQQNRDQAEHQFTIFQVAEGQDAIYMPNRVCNSLYPANISSVQSQQSGLNPLTCKASSIRKHNQNLRGSIVQTDNGLLDANKSQERPLDELGRSFASAHLSQAPQTRGHIKKRKKSHELNQLMYKSTADQQRINKLINFSITSKLEKQREQTQIELRDEFAIIPAFGNFKVISGCSTVTHSSQTRKRPHQLAPLGSVAISKLEDQSSQRTNYDAQLRHSQLTQYGGVPLTDINRTKKCIRGTTASTSGATGALIRIEQRKKLFVI